MFPRTISSVFSCLSRKKNLICNIVPMPVAFLVKSEISLRTWSNLSPRYGKQLQLRWGDEYVPRSSANDLVSVFHYNNWCWSPDCGDIWSKVRTCFVRVLLSRFCFTNSVDHQIQWIVAGIMKLFFFGLYELLTIIYHPISIKSSSPKALIHKSLSILLWWWSLFNINTKDI